ncbi:MAG: hypothetical protein ABI167_11375, partial [Nitrosospira sp.]
MDPFLQLYCGGGGGGMPLGGGGGGGSEFLDGGGGPMNALQQLTPYLKELRLSGMLSGLESR